MKDLLSRSMGERRSYASTGRDGSAGHRGAGAQDRRHSPNPDRRSFAPLYPDDDAAVRQDQDHRRSSIYRAVGRQSPASRCATSCTHWEAQGYGKLPMLHGPDPVFASRPIRTCAARRPAMSCRCARCSLSAGAGFVVAICGEIMTMPGLPRRLLREDLLRTRWGRSRGCSKSPGNGAGGPSPGLPLLAHAPDVDADDRLRRLALPGATG